MIKIAIAGTPEGAENFINALAPLGAEGHAVLEETDFSSYDGLILPGGADIDPELFGEENWGCRKIQRERDILQLTITDHFVKAKKPILGVCKGHQILNVYFGGTVMQHIPEYEIHQWDEATEQDQTHDSCCREGCFLEKLYGREFPINSAHHQALGTLAPCFREIQHSTDGVLEGMVHNTLPIIGLQWHPERMTGKHLRSDTVDGKKIFEFFLKLISGEETVY